MRKIRNIFIVLFVTLPFASLLAQDTITDLGSNALIKNYLSAQPAKSLRKTTVAADTLGLPFIDDFSGRSIYPNNKLWLDSNVYINTNLPISPVTIGVATFDGLNKFGVPYNNNLPDKHGLADSLTSKPIDLSGGIDSVYLSFFYQAGGNGNMPEVDDSLILQFKKPGGTWVNMLTLSNTQTISDSSFKQVLVKVDTSYCKKGFQFRFKNYATLSGALDHWHIDYIILNKDRKYNNRYFEDVGFVRPVSNLLNNSYTAMPWGHYIPANTTTAITVSLRNTSDTNSLAKNVNYTYSVENKNGNMLYNPSPAAKNIKSDLTKEVFIQSPFNYQFPVAATLHDTTTFIIKNIINTTPDNIRINDTIIHYQHFDNYYSYDDGSAENGYGLNTFGGKLAYKFNLTKADTLRAIQIYFNQLLYNLSERTFKLTVWSSLNPETIIYQTEEGYNTPDYTNTINGYSTYILSHGVPVSGTIYVGWVQNTADVLNVGFDKSANNAANIFYNTNTGWLNTTFKGSLMIRPVVGNVITTGIAEAAPKLKAEIYPNPANEIIYIKTENPGKAINYTLYDIQGRELIQGKLSEQSIDVTGTPAGLYLLRLTDLAGNSFSQKIMITK